MLQVKVFQCIADREVAGQNEHQKKINEWLKEMNSSVQIVSLAQSGGDYRVTTTILYKTKK